MCVSDRERVRLRERERGRRERRKKIRNRAREREREGKGREGKQRVKETKEREKGAKEEEDRWGKGGAGLGQLGRWVGAEGVPALGNSWTRKYNNHSTEAPKGNRRTGRMMLDILDRAGKVEVETGSRGQKTRQRVSLF